MITKRKFETLKEEFLKSCLTEMYQLVEHYRQDVHFVFYDGKFSVDATTQMNWSDFGVYYIETVNGFCVNDDFYSECLHNDYFNETLIEVIITGNADEFLSWNYVDVDLFSKLDLESLRNRIVKMKAEYDSSSEIEIADIVNETLLEDEDFQEFYNNYIRSSYIEHLNYKWGYEHILKKIAGIEYEEVKEWMEENG